MTLTDRINKGKTYTSEGWRRCGNKTCNTLYETHTQSPLCPDCKRFVQNTLAEEMLNHGIGYTH